MRHAADGAVKIPSPRECSLRRDLTWIGNGSRKYLIPVQCTHRCPTLVFGDKAGKQLLADFAPLQHSLQRDAAFNGVRYREIFWNPNDHADLASLPHDVAQDALIDGLSRAERDFGIIGRLIPSIDRSLSPERVVKMVSDVVASPSPFTLGIGFDFLETDGLPESFWKAFRLAHENGRRCTAHAGEDGSYPRSVETCLDLLHCSRIDHGYTVLEDEALTQRETLKFPYYDLRHAPARNLPHKRPFLNP